MGEYLYCIIAKDGASKKFDVRGINNEEIRCIDYKDLRAIVGEAPMKEYEPTEENTERHKQVALNVLKDHTVLPVAFGMVFKTRGVLINTMRRVYPVLKKSLRLTDNKIELGVKVVFPNDPKEIEKLANGKSKEEFIAECESEFVNALKKTVAETKKGKLFSERLVLNHYFLVDRTRIDEFSAVLGKLDDKYGALKTRYTGPWPPYNFVDIRIMSRGR